MTKGVGGCSVTEAMNQLSDMTQGIDRIDSVEFQDRLSRLQALMKQEQVGAVFLHASTNLLYFTGLKWGPSERMVAAVVPSEGPISYIAPQFELDTLRDYWRIPAEIHAWEEHECPYALSGKVLGGLGVQDQKVLFDESTPYFMIAGFQAKNPEIKIGLAQPLTQQIRSRKTTKEIDLIRRAHEMTLEVIKAAASILRPGITTGEVVDFINKAHKKVGAPAGSFFCIVLFDVGTSFPHGVKESQTLKQDDWVLIDTGCLLDGYNSDITRSFCFGTPTEAHRKAWNDEKSAQLAAFDAAKIGEPCEVCDYAARAVLDAAGYGPDYKLPGLPHRTGHGCGLDIHEGPNLVRGEKTPMAEGMVFSDEPMLVIPDQFGVRLEDHFYMSAEGPVWFTQPSKSIDEPFD